MVLSPEAETAGTCSPESFGGFRVLKNSGEHAISTPKTTLAHVRKTVQSIPNKTSRTRRGSIIEVHDEDPPPARPEPPSTTPDHGPTTKHLLSRSTCGT